MEANHTAGPIRSQRRHHTSRAGKPYERPTQQRRKGLLGAIKDIVWKAVPSFLKFSSNETVENGHISDTEDANINEEPQPAPVSVPTPSFPPASTPAPQPSFDVQSATQSIQLAQSTPSEAIHEPLSVLETSQVSVSQTILQPFTPAMFPQMSAPSLTPATASIHATPTAAWTPFSGVTPRYLPTYARTPRPAPVHREQSRTTNAPQPTLIELVPTPIPRAAGKRERSPTTAGPTEFITPSVAGKRSRNTLLTPATTSATARRILETLNQLSSPLVVCAFGYLVLIMYYIHLYLYVFIFL